MNEENPASPSSSAHAAPPRHSQRTVFLTVLAVVFLGFVMIMVMIGVTAALTELEGDLGEYGDDADFSAESLYGCNAIGIEIRGCIWTYFPEVTDYYSDGTCDDITSSEEVVWQLAAAAENPDIKAVVLQIDSGGGSSIAAEEIANALKASGLPAVAWVRQNADSAAYWIASAADTVIASETSEVGSIGVTYSYVDNADQNSQDGLSYNQLIAGKYKDMGSPDRALTSDERSLIQRDLDIIHDVFIRAVATNRGLPEERVRALADGSTMLGKMALENGLIDQIGSKKEVWDKLGTLVGDEPEVCWN